MVICVYRDNNPHNARDNRRLAWICAQEYYPAMSLTFSEALSSALETTRTPLRQIAEKAEVSYEQLKKVKQGKTQSTNVDDAKRVAEALGLTLDQFLSGNFDSQPTIAIAGKVGAGARIPVFDAYEKGDGPQVEVPSQLSAHGVVAVEVVGDSMEPIYSAGDVLFYTRETAEGVPSEAIGSKCVCEDIDGMGWVKLVRPGSEPGLFHLISLNPGATTQYDVRLKWAAKVRLHLADELVRRV